MIERRPGFSPAIGQVWRAFALYAVAMVVAGLARGWGAPLSLDEQHYYLPAVQYFAERLPDVPLDYPMPMPPFALVVQGLVYRLTGSVAVLRILSTAAAIAAAAVFATMLKDTRRDALLLLMFCAFPAALMNAFTLKHYALVLLFCLGALAAWERKRIVLAAVLLAAGALTHQIAGAMIGALVVFSLLERRTRDAAILSLSALPLAALVLLWGGARPPLHAATHGQGEPAMAGLHPAQILVVLFMAGAWIAPAVLRRWIPAVIALPFTALWMHTTGLMHHYSSPYGRLAGPVSSFLVAVTRQDLLAAIAGGALAALGVALLIERHPPLRVWSAMYAILMLAVPYFFESYYGLFATIAWVLLRQRIAERPPWFSLAAIAAGIAYFIVKV